MGTYFDNYITITGTPSAVNSAAESLKQFMQEYYGGDWDKACDEIHCDIDTTTKRAGRGTVALSCYTAGPRLDMVEWMPNFGEGGRGNATLDIICERGCDRLVFRRKQWEAIDSCQPEVWHSAFDLWCRAKSDRDADGVYAAILSKLSEPDLCDAVQSYSDGDPEDLNTAALLIQSIGRLTAGGRLSGGDQKIKTLHKTIAAIPASADALLGMGYEIIDDEDNTLLRAAKVWAEEEILRAVVGKTKEFQSTLPPKTAKRI